MPIKNFPRWVYHHSAAAKIVESQEERDSLDENWVDSPALVKRPEEVSAYDPAEEVGDENENEVEELGLDEPGSNKRKRKRK